MSQKISSQQSPGEGSPRVYADTPGAAHRLRLQQTQRISTLWRSLLTPGFVLLAVGTALVAANMPAKLDSVKQHPFVQYACQYIDCARFERPVDYQHLYLTQTHAISQGNTFIFSGELVSADSPQHLVLAWPQLGLELLNSAGKKVLEYRISPQVYLPKGAAKHLGTEQKQPIHFSVETQDSVVKYRLRFSEKELSA